MTSESDPRILLEIYKLHAELADRVSQRREAANRLHVSLLAGLIVFVAVLLRYRADDEAETMVLCAIGFLGMCLAVSWYIVIRSHRQLNTGKLATLTELEKMLPYPFFTREWKLLREGRSVKSYWKLSVVETGAPMLFFILFLGLMIFPYLGNS